MSIQTITRPLLESLACVNPDCDCYAQKAANNLTIRKRYGKDDIRYLRCRVCQEEFSERRNTALFNTKIREEKAVAIAKQLAEGSHPEAIVRVESIDVSTVDRLQKRLGQHAFQWHDEHVVDVEVSSLQADERHGFAGNKQNRVWEAEMIDPHSKFVLSHVQGKRDEALIEALYTDTVKRLHNKHAIALFTDGFESYATLFPHFFGRKYPQSYQGVGRPRKSIYRIPHTAAHVQIVKHRQGYRLSEVEIRYRHGSQRRIADALTELNYNVPNTSTIERRNGTARLMTAAQHRKTLTFAKRDDKKWQAGWWSLVNYNWCRTHRSLRVQLPEPQGKKNMNKGHLQSQ